MQPCPLSRLGENQTRTPLLGPISCTQRLATVTQRRAIDIIRATHPERFISLEDADDYTNDHASLTTRVGQSETIRLLLEALRHRFSERDAQILVLTEFLREP
jgi:hypothetical protein